MEKFAFMLRTEAILNEDFAFNIRLSQVETIEWERDLENGYVWNDNMYHTRVTFRVIINKL